MARLVDMPAYEAETTADQPIEHKISGEHRTVKVAPTASAPSTRMLANEVPVAIEFDGEPYAVMMLTPADFEDFAVGFALAERIVTKASDIARIDVREGLRGIGVDIRLEKEHRDRLLERRRALPGQSGCGICGLTTIEEALPQLEPFATCPQVASSAIFSALQSLPARQRLNKATGAVHAAAFCRPNGDIVAAREDVGRHNALDKVIGHLMRESVDPSQGFALLTSRCSYELVQKAVLARIPMLATISAPTELAVAMAEGAKLTLVALARADSLLIFNDPFAAIAKPLR